MAAMQSSSLRLSRCPSRTRLRCGVERPRNSAARRRLHPCCFNWRLASFRVNISEQISVPMKRSTKNISSDINNFGDRLDAVMKENDLKQNDIADRTGVSQATVSGWLNGSLPQPRTALALSKAIGVSMRWLMTGHGEKEDLTIVRQNEHADSWKTRALAAESKLAEIKITLSDALKKI